MKKHETEPQVTGAEALVEVEAEPNTEEQMGSLALSKNVSSAERDAEKEALEFRKRLGRYMSDNNIQPYLYD